MNKRAKVFGVGMGALAFVVLALVAMVALAGCGAAWFSRYDEQQAQQLAEQAALQASQQIQKEQQGSTAAGVQTTLNDIVLAADRARVALERTAAETQARADAARQAGDEATAQTEARAADTARGAAGKLKNVTNHTVRDESGNLDTQGTLERTAASFLPPPWNVFAFLGLGLLAEWQRREKNANERAARGIVNAIDAGRMAPGSGLANAMADPRVKAAIQAELARNGRAAAIVHSERIDSTAQPIPVTAA